MKNHQQGFARVSLLIGLFTALLGLACWMYYVNENSNDDQMRVDQVGDATYESTSWNTSMGETIDTKVTSSATSPEAGITEADIKNASYKVWGGTEIIVLKDGEYDNSKNKLHSEVSHYSIRLSAALVSIISVRADSTDELFVVHKKNNQIITEVANVRLPAGQRIRNVKSIELTKNGYAKLGLSILAENDPYCCPSISGVYRFGVNNNDLSFNGEIASYRVKVGQKLGAFTVTKVDDTNVHTSGHATVMGKFEQREIGAPGISFAWESGDPIISVVDGENKKYFCFSNNEVAEKASVEAAGKSVQIVIKDYIYVVRDSEVCDFAELVRVIN